MRMIRSQITKLVIRLNSAAVLEDVVEELFVMFQGDMQSQFRIQAVFSILIPHEIGSQDAITAQHSFDR
jgi:hypothetical protein